MELSIDVVWELMSGHRGSEDRDEIQAAGIPLTHAV